MARALACAVLVLAITACRGSHAAAPSPYDVDHVRKVFAAHHLPSTVPRNLALGWTCTDLAGYRAILEGGMQWHGVVFKDERSASRLDRCMAERGSASGYLHLRRRNLVVVARTSLRRRIQVALDAL